MYESSKPVSVIYSILTEKLPNSINLEPLIFFRMLLRSLGESTIPLVWTI